MPAATPHPAGGGGSWWRRVGAAFAGPSTKAGVPASPPSRRQCFGLGLQDTLAFKAFQNEGILTAGADHFEVDWEAMWRERLAELGGRTTGALRGAAGGGGGWGGRALARARRRRGAQTQAGKGDRQPQTPTLAASPPSQQPQAPAPSIPT